ncbi:uncharacterized protein LOC124633375 [Helicoverpa zea]|uniref:uncharacterized protein LOC124633375 n=1 Tax=Helicoverpa zea TaxID=7113 RepID=UPI001F596E6A|nr:uncharacterized protein LOC124633375 [Helicoverpa zea]
MQKKKRKIKMECRQRRSRRQAVSCNTLGCESSRTQLSKPWNFLYSISSFLILSSLLGVIYLMLDYHCATCDSKCDLNTINKSIEDIAKNLAIMKNSYYDLELKISRFSQELPKIEGQIDILEALAAALENKETGGWDPNQRAIPAATPMSVYV